MCVPGGRHEGGRTWARASMRDEHAQPWAKPRPERNAQLSPRPHQRIRNLHGSVAADYFAIVLIGGTDVITAADAITAYATNVLTHVDFIDDQLDQAEVIQDQVVDGRSASSIPSLRRRCAMGSRRCAPTRAPRGPRRHARPCRRHRSDHHHTGRTGRCHTLYQGRSHRLAKFGIPTELQHDSGKLS